MGARQSRRSVDITTTPKKEGLPVEGVVGDAAAPGDGKLEKIEEADAKPTTNGVALHTDATTEDKDKDKDEATEKEKEKEDTPVVEESKVESPTTETPAEGAAEVTTPTEGTPANPASLESKETKKKDKPKKKWSFRSISFGKKDKNKPVREDAPKNGDVAKETLAEGGEEAETTAVVSSPADEKSTLSSPTEKEESEAEAEASAAAAAVTEAKAEDENATAVVAEVTTGPAEEKTEEPSIPAPTPVPVEAKKVEEKEKEVEPANAENIVEVSPVQAVIEAPVEVISQPKQIATTTTSTTTTTAPSIIERKTSEDLPSQFPSSPPPTPIDPSPMQQAQQVAANASAIAEALKFPAEAANKVKIGNTSGHTVSNTLSTSSTADPDTEKFDNTPTSEYPEQTGNASPIPVITDNAAVTDNIETTRSESQKSDIQLTQVLDEKQVPTQVEEIVASEIVEKKNDDQVEMVTTEHCVENQVEAVTKENDAKNEIEIADTNNPVEIGTEENYTKNQVEIVTKEIVETIETVKPREDDLVIETEEGPVPVSGDLFVQAKPALVVPDSPVDDIKPIQDPMMVEKNVQSEVSLPKNVESTEDLIVETPEKSEISGTIVEVMSNEENFEKDVPPPLPASPVPVPKSTSQLLNFMSTQIEDSSVITQVINSANDVAFFTESISSSIPQPVTDISETMIQDQVADESQLQAEEQTDNSCSLPQSEIIPDLRVDQLVETNENKDLPEEIHEEEMSCQSFEQIVPNTENTIKSEISEAAVAAVIPDLSIPEIPTDTTLLTPPTSPSPTAAVKQLSSVDIPTLESSSQIEVSDDSGNREFNTESVEDSLNSYNDTELELKERLAETLEDNTPVICQLKNAVQENDQSKVEAPLVEKIVVANEIGTTETNQDAPKSPPPALPVENLAPAFGPTITEDVASVTKAIEEIDINEKAVAAAVNENIESATNEIIADMNHQNNINE